MNPNDKEFASILVADNRYVELENALRYLTNGAPGFDPRKRFRKDESGTMTWKIAADLALRFNHADVLAALAVVKPCGPSQIKPDRMRQLLARKTGQTPPKAEPEHKADVPKSEHAERQSTKTETDNATKGETKMTPTNDKKMDAALKLLAEALSGAQPVDEATVRKLAREEAEKITRPIIHVQLPDGGDTVVIDGHVHPLFGKVLALTAAGINVMLKGPAGCGKTHLCAQVAEALKRDFAYISGTAGASESQLVGRLLPTGDGGKFEYHSSPFIKIYENGGVFLFDEMDAFDPNMLVIVNSALANGGFMVEARSAAPYVKRHANATLLAATNTFGTGADAQYVGRFQLDAATLDRWYVIEMDYDRAFESMLMGGKPQETKAWQPTAAPTESELKDLGVWVWQVRDAAMKAGLRRVVSTRMVQKALAARRAGVPTPEVKRDLLTGWSKDELAKVGMTA